MGSGCLRPGAPGEQADLPLGRLLDVPLVPCDGARELRESRDRRGAVARLRVDQGRPRGAPGRGPRLHDVRPGDDRVGRVADERLADASSRAVLRRHLLSARSQMGKAGLHRDPRRDRARLARGAGEGRAVGRDDPRPPSRACDASGGAAAVPDTGVLDRTVGEFASSFDARRGGFGGAPKFPRPSELLFLLREHARTGARQHRATWCS